MHQSMKVKPLEDNTSAANPNASHGELKSCPPIQELAPSRHQGRQEHFSMVTALAQPGCFAPQPQLANISTPTLFNEARVK